MESTPPYHTPSHDLRPVPGAPVTEVDAEVLGPEPPPAPLIPPERRISWLGWLTAFLIFLVNKKIGLALFVALLVFKQFPALNLKQLPRAAGSLFRKLRS